MFEEEFRNAKSKILDRQKKSGKDIWRASNCFWERWEPSKKNSKLHHISRIWKQWTKSAPIMIVLGARLVAEEAAELGAKA